MRQGSGGGQAVGFCQGLRAQSVPGAELGKPLSLSNDVEAHTFGRIRSCRGPGWFANGAQSSARMKNAWRIRVKARFPGLGE